MEDHQWELLNKIHDIDKRVYLLENKGDSQISTYMNKGVGGGGGVTTSTPIIVEEKEEIKEEKKKEPDTDKPSFFQNKEIQAMLTKGFVSIGGILLTLVVSYLSKLGG